MPVRARSCPESYLQADELLWALQIAEHLPGRASMNQSGANTAACVSHRLVPAYIDVPWLQDSLFAQGSQGEDKQPYDQCCVCERSTAVLGCQGGPSL